MLQPAAIVPPTPISTPPAKRGPNSLLPDARHLTGPCARALNQVPSGMPTTRAVPHPAALGVLRMVLSIVDRLGPVMDSPHPQPASDPESQARSPTAPSASPVRGQGHVSDRSIDARPASPSAMSPTSPAIVGQCRSWSTASIAGNRSDLGVLSHSSRGADRERLRWHPGIVRALRPRRRGYRPRPGTRSTWLSPCPPPSPPRRRVLR